MHLFYTPHVSGDSHVLDEQESRHAVRVLRLGRGDQVILVDGVGGWFEAVILEDHPKACRLEIGTRTHDFRSLPCHLHIAISPTRSMDRFEWFLEKATEIGVSEITPLICRRTERSRLRYERQEKIIVSAMKQSLRAYKPVLNQEASLESFLPLERKGVKGIAHCMPEERVPLTGLPDSDSYTLLVGPEGDFTGEEVAIAREAGFIPFHLGPSRLRTETAAIHIVSAINLRYV
jgi:16S rRNA (uracil1498-N3)-methyltransferase